MIITHFVKTKSRKNHCVSKQGLLKINVLRFVS